MFGKRWGEMIKKRITKCKRNLVLPSMSALREATLLLDKKVLSHTINNKFQEGEEMKNYFV